MRRAPGAYISSDRRIESLRLVDVLLEPMFDCRRELLCLFDPGELIEEPAVVDVEISVDQDVSQADRVGESGAEGRRDRSMARSLRRTTTGSTGKALLAQALGEPRI